MVDQMISSQLGSLNTAAPAGPVWREPKLEQMKEMEEGKKEADELAPMYMEGRTVQMNQPWRQRVPMIVAGVLLLGVAVLLFSQLGSGSDPMPLPADSSGGSDAMATAAGVMLPPNATGATGAAEKKAEAAEVPTPAAVLVAGNTSNSTNATTNQTKWTVNATYQTNQTSNPSLIANYKASCPTLVKLHGACDYDLSVDDKTLPAHTLVRLVCPDECQILDRYQKICPSLLKLDGGCAHDLALEEKALPQGSYVRLVCQECEEKSTTAITTTIAITSTASREQVSLAPPERVERVEPLPAETAAAGQAAVKIRPSRWLAYVVSFTATIAWAGLCMLEYGWLRALGRESG